MMDVTTRDNLVPDFSLAKTLFLDNIYYSMVLEKLLQTTDDSLMLSKNIFIE